MPPVAAAHLLLFATLPPAIALAALVVSISLTFPFGRLYCAIHGSIELVFTAGAAAQTISRL